MVVQIETLEAVQAAEEIAAIDGVDVLFVGPLDLSVNLGCPADFTPPHFVEALQQVVAACQKHGKTAGILSRPQHTAEHKRLGFRFFCLGIRYRSGSWRVTRELEVDAPGIVAPALKAPEPQSPEVVRSTRERRGDEQRCGKRKNSWWNPVAAFLYLN